jgi:hypothetical protein
MVFIPVHHRRTAIEPTSEEAALLRELDKQGVRGDDLESALAGRGVSTERARLLAALGRPRSATARASMMAFSLAWVAFVMGFGLAERPLRHWLRENYPGLEWLVGLVIPLVILLFFLSSVLRRRLGTTDASPTTTRADKIDNKPIG